MSHSHPSLPIPWDMGGVQGMWLSVGINLLPFPFLPVSPIFCCTHLRLPTAHSFLLLNLRLDMGGHRNKGDYQAEEEGRKW